MAHCCVHFLSKPQLLCIHCDASLPKLSRNPCTRSSMITAVSEVLTPLSDCRQESVEKMNRRISGVSYTCGMDFHNGILCCGLLCARIVSLYFCLYFVSILYLFYGYHAKGYHAPSILQGLSHLHHCTATTPAYLHPGYRATVPSSISGLSHLSYHASPHT